MDDHLAVHRLPVKHGGREQVQREQGKRDHRYVGEAESDHEDTQDPQVHVGPSSLPRCDGIFLVHGERWRFR